MSLASVKIGLPSSKKKANGRGIPTCVPCFGVTDGRAQMAEEAKARREEQEKAFQGLADRAKVVKQSILGSGLQFCNSHSPR
jgi:hypothetical protein